MALILVVEDDPFVRACVVYILRHAGYEADVAGHGREAIELIAANHYQLVVTDISMPVMDGLKLIRTIRTRDPQMRILAMSGGQSPSGLPNVAVAIGVGATEAIDKPFSSPDFLAKIKRLVAA